jgi:hypothetical protein
MGTVLVLVVMFQTVNVTSTKEYQAWDPAKYRLPAFCRPPFSAAESKTQRQSCRELRDI